MAVVAPHGVLFRGGAEAHIRRYLIEDRNYLDAVIGLPANIFYGTGIPTSILVFKKCRENPEEILFIDASKGFEKSGNQNYLRISHIDKIINTYRERKTEDKYSYATTLQEVKDNDYNLNIPRYVDTFEKEETIVIKNVAELLQELDGLSKVNDLKIINCCNVLKIPAPLGNNLSLLEQYKKGLMQQIFNQEIRFKDDNGKDYPDWEDKKLGDVFAFINTNSFSRSQLNYTKGKVKNIHYGDIHTKYKSNFDITKENVPFLNEDIDTEKIPEENFCKQGDLIVADASEDYNDIGKAIEIVNLGDEKLTAGLHTYIVRDNNHITAIGFKGYLMKSYYVRLQMMKMATGISVLGINKGNLSKIKIYLPVKEEQQKIANFLTGIDNKIDLVNQQLEKTKEFKKGLLQQMFV